ncbi:hypothetical protein I317_01785 [Kwoniella heveanensis CBS 569]|nr:hypothetical protein I317_01785 [Kwoniella heveanensis CBS 569]
MLPVDFGTYASRAMTSSISVSTLDTVQTVQHDRSAAIFTVVMILAVLSTTFVSLRMISKGWIVRKVTLDDWVAVLAWFFCISCSILIMIGTRVGLGRIGSEVKAEWVAPLRKITYAFTVFYNPAIMTIKVAILILYIRMSTAHRFLRIASIATMVVVLLTGIICTFICIFRCHPVSAGWSARDNSQCIDIISLYLSTAPINILTDLAILLLPLPILTSLRMEYRQKVVLVTTFIVGGFVTIVDVVRIAYLQQALKAERLLGDSGRLAATIKLGDFTYYISFALMWSTIETSVGLMCCCVLVLKPLVMRVIPAMLKENRGQSATPKVETVALTQLSKSPKSPNSDDNQIPKPNSAPVLNTNGFIGESRSANGDSGEVEEDDEMDFFQMLASDPPVGATSGGMPATQTSGGAVGAPVAFASMGRSTTQGPMLLPVPDSPPKFSSMTRKISKQTIFKRSRNGSGGSKEDRDNGQAPSGTFFDFVKMGGHKPLSELSGREAFGPICFVSVLFFLWGFSYGLLGTLNGQIQVLLGFAPSQNLALHSAYWVAYFFGPVVSGYWILHRHGFKATFVTGLALYSAGAMAFWPSAVLTSYAGFFISNFLVALGLSTLETAANPFIALAGPGELSEARLNFAQAIQAIGGLVSSILANKVLFTSVSQDKLFNVQWCYLAVAIFVLFLAAIFFYAPLNEANDDDLEIKATRRFEHANLDRHATTFGIPTRQFLLGFGVFVMWAYVGSQESVSFAWAPLISYMKPSADTFWTHSIGQALFFASRVLASAACFFGVPPRFVLLFFIAGSFLTSLLAMTLSPGNPPLVMMILHMFFEAPIFPTLFAMVIRNQGRHTKFASALLIMSICGGAVFPPIVWKIEVGNRSHLSLCLVVVVVLYGLSLFYPIILSSSSVLRRWVDPKWSKRREGDVVAPPHEDLHHTPTIDKRTRDELGLPEWRDVEGDHVVWERADSRERTRR